MYKFIHKYILRRFFSGVCNLQQHSLRSRGLAGLLRVQLHPEGAPVEEEHQGAAVGEEFRRRVLQSLKLQLRECFFWLKKIPESFFLGGGGRGGRGQFSILSM